jgi:GTP-binding protein
MPRPIVAIVGRPNVGKSTLFNRILRRRQAVVDDMPGVTRDRLAGETDWAGRRFLLVDTGGLLPDATRGMDASVRKQVEAALELAHVVLFTVDVEVGITSLDEQIARAVRQSGRPVLLTANKSDSENRALAAQDFAGLGFGEPYPVSALHGRGSGDLLDAVVAALPEEKGPERDEEEGIRVAIIGRPNVGKSSLVNRLLGEERMIVDDAPGTTRDAVDSRITIDGQVFTLVDTAGLRRRTRIDTRTEFYSAVRAMQALDRADVAVLMLDASEPFGRQDYRIAGFVHAASKPAILAFNKWDLVGEKETMTAKRMEDSFRAHAIELTHAPALFLSTVSGQRVGRLAGLIRQVYAEARRQWPQSELTAALRAAVDRQPPPSPPRGRQDLRAMVQRGVNPLRFLIVATQPEALPVHYLRYLSRDLRERLGIAHAPLELRLSRPRKRYPAIISETPDRPAREPAS